MANKKKNAFGFFLKFAWQNLLRNKRTYIPYLAAYSIMAGVYLLINGLSYTETLDNVPSGESASMIFTLGAVVFSVFTLLFLIYINSFLISQRKREFGLYGVLGLEKRHVSAILIIENAIVSLAGILLGIVIAMVFGQLIFWILMKVINSVPGSYFSIGGRSYAVMLTLFAIIFILTTIIDIRQVRLANPIELMTSQKKGEKENRSSLPGAILGVLMLGAAYYFAWTIDVSGTALLFFFPLATLVIFATYMLSKSGSIAILETLKKNKKYYYKPEHFISISGLTQRLRQNARGLASICILSTMLIVSVSGTLSLYLGQNNMLKNMHPFDVYFCPLDDVTDEQVVGFESVILDLADEYGVTLSADPSKLTTEINSDLEGSGFSRCNYVPEDAKFVELSKLIYFDDGYRFDAEGELYTCDEFCNALYDAYHDFITNGGEGDSSCYISSIFSAKINGYGLYGGLLFLGVFFGLLFLAVTILIMYFKQITEGYEDRERYVLLQKVGMDDKMVKRSISSQVIWVFFIPLAITVLHMIFASHIMTVMLRTFELNDYWLVLGCIGIVIAFYVLMYFIVYRLTARVYYKIVKW